MVKKKSSPNSNVWLPDTSMKVRYEGPLYTCMSKEHYNDIHDLVNDQGFAVHYRGISNTVSHLEVLRCERINTAKQKDGLTFFVMLSVLEAKIFQHGFLEEQCA